ncbi:hypothetical protein Bca4012_083131 [Brassica carinata]
MINEDLILDIMSCCPATEISKFRLLSKACNKRSYEFHFINHHLNKTNSALGYFIQDHKKYRRPGVVVFGAEEKAPEKPRISLQFLPSSRDVKIEACDAHHGVLLCVDHDKFKGGRRIPDYIVCKPTTKQYRIIPNPKTRYFTIAIGLMVIQSNPFRYKIVRVSEPLPWERRKTSEGFSNLNCEVFDSDTYAWKQLSDLELPSGEFFRRSEKPESSYGFLHWLTGNNNVIQFCMQTETWSFFPLPEDVIGDGSSLDLVSYEGKLAVLCSNSRGGYELRVLDNNSGKSWANYVNDCYSAEKYLGTYAADFIPFPGVSDWAEASEVPRLFPPGSLPLSVVRPVPTAPPSKKSAQASKLLTSRKRSTGKKKA